MDNEEIKKLKQDLAEEKVRAEEWKARFMELRGTVPIGTPTISMIQAQKEIRDILILLGREGLTPNVHNLCFSLEAVMRLIRNPSFQREIPDAVWKGEMMIWIKSVLCADKPQKPDLVRYDLLCKVLNQVLRLSMRWTDEDTKKLPESTTEVVVKAIDEAHAILNYDKTKV